MKHLSISLAAIGLTGYFCSASAQEFLLQADWLNAVPGPPPGSSSVAIWSGGNESVLAPGTSMDAPRDASGIHLTSSAIGQTTDQILGSPQASNVLTTVV